MAWYWWVLITLAAFALGMASMRYFQKSRPPDRRTGERSEGRDVSLKLGIAGIDDRQFLVAVGGGSAMARHVLEASGNPG